MLTLNCPSCGAQVNFRSKASVFAVCSYCKSSLVRQDMNLEAVGKMSELQDDLSPIQIGTVGTFDKLTFEIVGRLQVAYADGFWNEWYALFQDHTEGWLAEAQGFYAVCFSRPADAPPRSMLRVGKTISLDGGEKYQIEDMRDVFCRYSEGELPVAAMKGRESFSVDLSDGDGGMGTIEYGKKETRLYTGSYQDFDDFKFKNLRRLDGW